jgi:hypothetical protein
MITYVNVGELDAAVVEQFEKDMVVAFQFQPDRFDRTEDGKRYDSATLNIALVGWWASHARAANAIVGLQSELKAIEAKLSESMAGVRAQVESMVAPGFFTAEEISSLKNRVTSELFAEHRDAFNPGRKVEECFPEAYVNAVMAAVAEKLRTAFPAQE